MMMLTTFTIIIIHYIVYGQEYSRQRSENYHMAYSLLMTAVIYIIQYTYGAMF